MKDQQLVLQNRRCSFVIN